MAFTTWSDLAVKLRNDLATGNWRRKSYDVDGIRTEFVSPQEFMALLTDVERRAAEESSDYCSRTQAAGAER